MARGLPLDGEKQAVHDFWDQASCGEELYLQGQDAEHYRHQAESRYRLEPFIDSFAGFDRWKGKRVLEIGVGLGADHQQFAAGGALCTGVDLTTRAVEHTRERFRELGLVSDLRVADAESLPFPDGAFDLVYSWGVLHHSPDTPKALSEVLRVLRPGGTAKVMIYHKHSLVGFMLWVRYALLRGRMLTSLGEIYAKYLESPGTKAYTVSEARELFRAFGGVKIDTVLTHGDLLSSSAGRRHQGALLSVARVVWPRWLIRRLFPKLGLFMLITAVKSISAR
jgi:ubiquinone/menaquinone biosynthesis C-methylase UbiE